LFIRCGESLFAMPLAFVEEIRRLRPEDIEEVGGKLLTKVRDVVTEVVRLDTSLGLPRVEPINGFMRMVIVNVGGRQIGVIVEDVLRKDEIVIFTLRSTRPCSDDDLVFCVARLRRSRRFGVRPRSR